VIVLDANILIRAVIGKRALDLIDRYADDLPILAPALAFEEAERHIPGILARRTGITATALHSRNDSGFLTLHRLRTIIEIIPEDKLHVFKEAANQRLRKRDPNDWPILAAALALDCPIWTEDTDFFGVGVATWTTDRVEIYLQSYAAAK
jgi:predicted nucleic acid-binding protein